LKYSGSEIAVPTYSAFKATREYGINVSFPFTEGKEVLFRPSELLFAGSNPVMYVDPSGHMQMMSMGNVVSVMSRMGTHAPKISSFIREVIGVDGKGGVIRLIADAVADTVMSEFINTNFDVTNQRIGGTKVHTRLEKLIKAEFSTRYKYPGGWYLYIVPEVFFDKNGEGSRRGKGTLGVDVLFYIVHGEREYTDADAKIILDFKTGKGWSNSHMNRLEDRFGKATIIQMFLPIRYK